MKQPAANTAVSKKNNAILRNVHFWYIFLIMACLTFVYYSDNSIIAAWLPQAARDGMALTPHWLQRRLFVVPVLYAGVIFRLRGAIVCWLTYLAIILPREFWVTPAQQSDKTRLLVWALIALTAGVLMALERNRNDKEKEAVSELAIARRTHLGRIIQAQEREKQHIVRELHDQTLQSLLVAANSLQSLANGNFGTLRSEIKKQVEKNRDAVLQIGKEVRDLGQSLRPSILDSMGLVSAIRWLAERLTSESNVAAKVEIVGEERKLIPEAEVSFFRIAQEALNNIRRHSAATDVQLTLVFDLTSVTLMVRDNGKGFRVPRRMSDLVAQGKLGLNGICERADLIGAACDVLSVPGKGTTITVRATI